MKKVFAFFLTLSLISILPTLSYAQTPPPGQTGGGIQQQEQQIQTERNLEKQIKSKKKKPEEAVVTEKPTSLEEGKKTLVKKIDVKGVTLIPQDIVNKIITLKNDKCGFIEISKQLCIPKSSVYSLYYKYKEKL